METITITKMKEIANENGITLRESLINDIIEDYECAGSPSGPISEEYFFVWSDEEVINYFLEAQIFERYYI